MMIINGNTRGFSMCTCPTKTGPRGANAVGEEVLDVHKCVLLGKEFGA